jgi:hypothetical protein
MATVPLQVEHLAELHGDLPLYLGDGRCRPVLRPATVTITSPSASHVGQRRGKECGELAQEKREGEGPSLKHRLAQSKNL